MILKNTMIAGAVAIAAVSGSTLILAASDSNINPGGQSAQTVAVEQVVMAHNLISYGDANKDAMALIVAARVLKANPTHPVDATKTTEGDVGKAASNSDAPAGDSVATVLARAKKYAVGRKDLIALADDVAASSSKGRVGGPAVTTSYSYAGTVDTWPIRFRGGEPAIVAIAGDGDTDLDFSVYDANGNLGPHDTDNTDYTRLSWTPRVTGMFYIKIKNHGSIRNTYRIATN